jgi:hypothetical protein
LAKDEREDIDLNHKDRIIIIIKRTFSSQKQQSQTRPDLKKWKGNERENSSRKKEEKLTAGFVRRTRFEPLDMTRSKSRRGRKTY